MYVLCILVAESHIILFIRIIVREITLYSIHSYNHKMAATPSCIIVLHAFHESRQLRVNCSDKLHLHEYNLKVLCDGVSRKFNIGEYFVFYCSYTAVASVCKS
jgi:hypothetical protein